MIVETSDEDNIFSLIREYGTKVNDGATERLMVISSRINELKGAIHYRIKEDDCEIISPSNQR